jgi:hypothetical protein
MSRHNLNKRQTGPTTLSHEAANASLYTYANEAVLGHAPEALYPEVAAHLATCVECCADLDELLTHARSAHAGAIEPAPSYPKVNLARLTPPWRNSNTTPHPWFVDRLGRLWVDFSEALLTTLRPPAFAGGARESSLLYAFHARRQSPHDLAWTIQILAEAESEMVAMQINVDVPNRRPFDQAGSQVVLHMEQATRHDATDELGSVAFEHIPLNALPKLRVEIRPLEADEA